MAVKQGNRLSLDDAANRTMSLRGQRKNERLYLGWRIKMGFNMAGWGGVRHSTGANATGTKPGRGVGGRGFTVCPFSTRDQKLTSSEQRFPKENVQL